MPGTVHVTSRRQAFQTSVIHTDFGAYSVTFLSSRFTFSKNNWHKSILKLFHISFFFLDFIYLLLQRGRKGEREGEKRRLGYLSHTPYWAPGLQPRLVPWLRIELSTFRFAAPLNPLSYNCQGYFIFLEKNPRWQQGTGDDLEEWLLTSLGYKIYGRKSSKSFSYFCRLQSWIQKVI